MVAVRNSLRHVDMLNHLAASKRSFKSTSPASNPARNSRPFHFTLREALLLVMAIAVTFGLLRLNLLFAAVVLPWWIIGAARRVITHDPAAWFCWGKGVPLTLSAFLWFAMSATVFPWLLFLDFNMLNAFTPLMGWAGGANYGFTIFFAWHAVFGSGEKRLVFVNSVRMFLPIFIALGWYDALRPAREDFGNPMLIVSPLRWIWTIAIPTTWLMALMLPSVRRYASKKGVQTGQQVIN